MSLATNTCLCRTTAVVYIGEFEVLDRESNSLPIDVPCKAELFLIDLLVPSRNPIDLSLLILDLSFCCHGCENKCVRLMLFVSVRPCSCISCSNCYLRLFLRKTANNDFLHNGLNVTNSYALWYHLQSNIVFLH